MSQILDLLQKTSEPENDINGSLSPLQVWTILQDPLLKDDIKLIDVRTNEERVFTGYISESIHLSWATGTNFNRNPRFIKEVENKFGKKSIIVLICRSGNRSKLAATALKNNGFHYVYHVREGFEGDLNEKYQRNQINGWKFHQLPWIQS